MKVQKNINYSISEAKSRIINRESWSSYVVLDDFLDEDFFQELSNSYNLAKQKFISNYEKNWFRFLMKGDRIFFNNAIFNNSIFTTIEFPSVWRNNEQPGVNLTVGGGGSVLESFKKLFLASEPCKNLIEWIYSNAGHEYFLDIFSGTPSFNNNVSKKDMLDSIITCKVSSQLNNYGYYIHPDASQKVISYLLYLGDIGWNQDSIGGTDLWEDTRHKVQFSKDKNSLDYQFRNGRFSQKKTSVRLTMEEAERVRIFKNIEFKPNRLVGFVRTDKSYHSIHPRILPSGISRDCPQINIWNLKSRIK